MGYTGIALTFGIDCMRVWDLSIRTWGSTSGPRDWEGFSLGSSGSRLTTVGLKGWRLFGVWGLRFKTLNPKPGLWAAFQIIGSLGSQNRYSPFYVYRPLDGPSRGECRIQTAYP